MKIVVIVLGVLGLADAILAPLVTYLGLWNAAPASWFGYLGACVCFGSLAVVDAIGSQSAAGVVTRRGHSLPTPDELLGPEHS